MFSSNQKLDITCETRDLASVIDFCTKLYADSCQMFTRSNGRVKIAFSEPMTGVYAIGTGSMAPYTTGPNKCVGHDCPDGWTDYPFDHDPEIIAKIIAQWLGKNPPLDTDKPLTDGTLRPGLRIRNLNDAYDILGDLCYKWPHHNCILLFTPCWMSYDK